MTQETIAQVKALAEKSLEQIELLDTADVFPGGPTSPLSRRIGFNSGVASALSAPLKKIIALLEAEQAEAQTCKTTPSDTDLPNGTGSILIQLIFHAPQALTDFDRLVPARGEQSPRP